MRKRRGLALWILIFMVMTARVGVCSDTLTIYDLQFSSAEREWMSAYDGQIVSFVGGVVTHKIGFRITLQDPTAGAWAGIEIRAFENPAPLGAVSVGDRVDFFDIWVEEFRGGTIPQFKSYSEFQIVSSGNPLPEPVLVPVEDLGLPPDRERCEKYEGMLVVVENVRVGRMDLGKAEDNYELLAEADTMWASDYCNYDIQNPPFPTYYVSRGQRYNRITGVFQEYLYPRDGWDYYQLLPRGASDYVESSLYTLRDVQESSEADGWASPMEGTRVALRAIVSSERSAQGVLTLGDPLLGGAWAGVFVQDFGGALADLVIGDEVDLENVLVEEQSGHTVLIFDGESGYAVVGSGRSLAGTIVRPTELGQSAGPEIAEKYEGMLVSVYNVTVGRRGPPEGADLYTLVAGADTLLGTDLESAVLPPDSTFFVRERDRLGRIRGIVTERSLLGRSRYVLQPRCAKDYGFVGPSQVLSSWGRVKQRFKPEG